MAIRVVPYLEEHEPLVQAMNARMAQGGSSWAFYDKATPNWLPPGLSPDARRDFYLALDEDNCRAGYVLKTETFLLRGEPFVLASIQGPVSEGAVNPAFGSIAFQLVRDMEDRCEHLFGWGPSEKAYQLLNRMGYSTHFAPLQLRVVRAGRFCRFNAFLRGSRRNRFVLDLLAFTGAAAIGTWLAQTAVKLGAGGARSGRVETREVDRFGDWADEIWAQAKGSYGLIARRDRATMNARLPREDWPQGQILQVVAGGATVGWAVVRNTKFENDGRFGSLRVGSIIDALAAPGREAEAIAAATRWLQSRGVDVITSNFMHIVWRRAFRAAGFLESANRRQLMFNPGAHDAIGDPKIVTEGLHITPLDGDGPHGL